MNRRQLSRRESCRGITMVELLVSMAIGLFIVSGVVKVMIDGKDSFLVEEQLSYIQDNARFVLDQMSYDMRMAGYFGCNTQAGLTNSVNGSTNSNSWMLSSDGIKGFEFSELTDTDFPSEIAGSILANTDVLIVNRGEPDDSLQVKEHKPNSATIDLTQASNLTVGQILVVASPSCTDMAIFQMTGPNNTSNPEHINHNTGNANPSPGNCDKALTGAYDCSEPPPNSFSGDAYPPGSSLMRFSSNAYFVGTSSVTGQPALFRRTLTVIGGDAGTIAQEVASGVEDLQIIYGLDANADGAVDRYSTADNISLWEQVLAARVTLIMRSAREVFPSDTSVNLGEGYTYNDRYMRQKVSSTVQIRNRGLGIVLGTGGYIEEIPVEEEN